MSRAVDASPRALTRTNKTTRLVFDYGDDGSLLRVSAERVQVVTDAQSVVVGRTAVGGVTLAVGDFPAGLAQRLSALDTLVDAAEAARGEPPPFL